MVGHLWTSVQDCDMQLDCWALPELQRVAEYCTRLQKLTPTLRQGRRAERRRGEEISSWFLPPLEKRLQKKVFESKCHWLAITDWDAGGVVHVNLLRLLFQCDQSRNRNIECVRQFTSNICPYQLMIVTTQTYLKRWQCADWSRQELEKEQTRRGEQRRGREFHRSCRHCYSCTSAAAAATCRDIWRIGWHLDHSLLPPRPRQREPKSQRQGLSWQRPGSQIFILLKLRSLLDSCERECHFPASGNCILSWLLQQRRPWTAPSARSTAPPTIPCTSCLSTSTTFHTFFCIFLTS